MSGVSIIIPVYNRKKYLNQAIDSVLNQDFDGKVEVIVVDDGSTDGSVEIAKSYGDKIIFIEKPEHCNSQGVSSTRNRGLKAVSQEFVSFLDSDDYYLPGYLHQMVSYLQNNEQCGYTFCRLKKIDRSGNLSHWTRTRMTKLDITYPFLFRSYGISTNTIVLRKTVFDIIGFFNEELSNGEDGDMWMRVGENFKGNFLNIYGAVYRIDHEASQLTNNNDTHILECASQVFIEALKRNFLYKSRDDVRILLILRTLFGIKSRVDGKNSKFHQFIIYLKLFLIDPLSFLRMCRLYMQKYE